MNRYLQKLNNYYNNRTITRSEERYDKYTIRNSKSCKRHERGM